MISCGTSSIEAPDIEKIDLRPPAANIMSPCREKIDKDLIGATVLEQVEQWDFDRQSLDDCVYKHRVQAEWIRATVAAFNDPQEPR